MSRSVAAAAVRGSGSHAPRSSSYPTRSHGIEIHDQPWCPEVIRSSVVNTLRQGWTLPMLPAGLRKHIAPVYTLAPVLEDVLGRSGVRDDGGGGRIVDLCSGMGGPMIEVARLLPKATVSISDLYPHPTEWRALTATIDNAGFVERSVDACDVGASEVGLRTIMAAYHHFPPSLAESVLRSAVRDEQPIAVVELTDRSLAAMATIVALTIPLGILSGVQALIKGRFLEALLTPINVAVLTIDGVTSCWRTYSVSELDALASAADPEGLFDWQVSERPASLRVAFWFKMRVLVGLPQQQRSGGRGDARASARQPKDKTV